MTSEMTPARPSRTYRSLNKPLTILGVERRILFLTLAVSVGTFNFFGSLLGGILMFGLLYGFGLWTTARDPALLSILLAAADHASFYDPLKRPEEPSR